MLNFSQASSAAMRSLISLYSPSKCFVARYIYFQLEAEGCDVTYDPRAGTARAFDNGEKVFLALQKGKGQPWIVRFIDSPRLQWLKPHQNALLV